MILSRPLFVVHVLGNMLWLNSNKAVFIGCSLFILWWYCDHFLRKLSKRLADGLETKVLVAKSMLQHCCKLVMPTPAMMIFC